MTSISSATRDVVTEATNAGLDTVEATVNYTLPADNNVEALYMFGSVLTGTGSGGPETLVSIGGPNTLVGLGGDDLYFLNNSADVVIEAADGGTDTVGATVNYTLPDNSNIETALHARLRVDRHGLGRRRHAASAAADPTPWWGLAAMISITSTTPPTW